MLPPLPVAGPLLVASLLLVFGKVLPRRVPDVVAILTALAAAAACAAMTAEATGGPLTYWFGGWVPRGGRVLGIAFTVDLAGGALGTVIGGMFAATLVFAWGYFDEVHAHFHVLMLLFMAGMIGFCLTHDVFNLFVWFEVMSVAAFSLTAYELTAAPLTGALNFTVLNSIASYLILGGIGLLYAVGGALDMGALAEVVARTPSDPVIAAAFVLMASGLLVKAAQVPFHFWLPDAHGVAPSPVSVMFSGAMVALGVFGLMRITFEVFAGAPAIMAVVHTLLLGLGVGSAVVGGVMSLLQRHLKRLLAFSTISHTGVLVIGLSLVSRNGTAGMLLYMVGHGLVKAALFMVAGILLATCGGTDEIALRGRGARVWPAGVAMAMGGLLLAGLPVGLMDGGITTIAAEAAAQGQRWLWLPLLIGAAVTGAAVLRAAGRIFLGWGSVPGVEVHSPSAEEQEKANRPLWLMLAPAAVLLAAACLDFDAASLASRAGVFAMPAAAAAAPLPPIPAGPLAWIAVVSAVSLAAYQLVRGRLPGPVLAVTDRTMAPLATGLVSLHSGAVGDYVAWLAAGLAAFTVAFCLA